MNYKKHYTKLIRRAKKRVLEGYSERHHIVPRCMGGSNDPSNLVDLTPEEHYVAHQLLVKMHTGHYGLIWAVVQMTGGTERTQRNNKLYGWLRRKFSAAVAERQTGKRHTDESKAKMSKSRLGVNRKPHSEETKRKMSLASKGKPKSKEHKKALSIARTGLKRGPNTAGANQNISKGLRNSVKLKRFAKIRYKSFANRIKTAKGTADVWARRRAGLLPMPKSMKHLEPPNPAYLLTKESSG